MGTTAEVRAFIALELDAGLHVYLEGLIEDLKPSVPGLRFGPVANAHLTLRFLGPSSPTAIDRIARALEPAAAACPAADVPLAGLGTFPPHGAPRILWLGLDLPGPMRTLQAACERAARDAGFEPETRAFRPHLTLGRWRERASRPHLPAIEPLTTRIERVTLFRSELKPSGAVHTPLHRFALGGPNGTAILGPSE